MTLRQEWTHVLIRDAILGVHLSMDQYAEIEPAGFWRRAAACLIDWAICALILGCLAAVLFAATGGRSQMVPSLVPRWCWNVDPLPTELTLPPGFEPNVATLCQHSLLGWPATRILTLTERTVEGNVTTNINMQLALDADDMAWPGDISFAPTELLLVLFRLVFDAFARSPGRRLCRIAVTQRATGRRAPFSLLWKRYLLFSIPIGLGYLTQIPDLSPDVSQGTFGSALGVWLVPAVASLSLSFWIVVSIVRRRPAFYDRPVGTGVERR